MGAWGQRDRAGSLTATFFCTVPGPGSPLRLPLGPRPTGMVRRARSAVAAAVLRPLRGGRQQTEAFWRMMRRRR